MKHASHLLELSAAFNQVLPSDKYTSVDEWLQRHMERMKDLGYTSADAAALIADVRQKIALREEARTTLTDIVARKCRITRGDDALKTSARLFVMKHLQHTRHFTGIHPSRDLARYAKHIAYFSRRSTNIKQAYQQLFGWLQSLTPEAPRPRNSVVRAATPTTFEAVQPPDDNAYLLQIIAANSPEQVNAFAVPFGFRYWSATDAPPYRFYQANTFTTCPYTELPVVNVFA